MNEKQNSPTRLIPNYVRFLTIAAAKKPSTVSIYLYVIRYVRVPQDLRLCTEIKHVAVYTVCRWDPRRQYITARRISSNNSYVLSARFSNS